MGDDEGSELERQVDEQEERADEARERASEAAHAEDVDDDIPDYGGEPPERQADGETPPAIRQ